MSRIASFALFAGLVLVGTFLAALLWAPGPLIQAWQQLGLSPHPLERLSAALGGARSDLGLGGDEVAQPAPHMLSGTIEGVEFAVAADVTARIDQVLVDEGDSVRAGQPLVRLDDGLSQARLEEAQRAVATARANVDAVRAGPTRAEIAAARSDVEQARTTWDGAWQALLDARQAQETPLALEAQVNAARSRVALAPFQVEQARARQAAVVALREGIAGDGSDQGKTQRAAYEKQEAAIEEEIAAAQAELQGAERSLAQLRAMRNSLLELAVAVRAAEWQLEVAAQGVQVAQAALDAAMAGPRPQELALAAAQLAEVEAGRDVLLAQAESYVLSSPAAGVITTRMVDPGDLAVMGSPLLIVSDLSRVTLTVYVPGPRIGHVFVGQPATVQVDAYPDRVFQGVVSALSPEAEFTPANVLTSEERARIVFAAEITLPNPDRALKPGMPADAVLAGE